MAETAPPLFQFTTQEDWYGAIPLLNADAGNAPLEVAGRTFEMWITPSTLGGTLVAPVVVLNMQTGGGLEFATGGANTFIFRVLKSVTTTFPRGDFTADLLEVVNDERHLFMPVRINYSEPSGIRSFLSRAFAVAYAAARQPIVTSIGVPGRQGSPGATIITGTVPPVPADGKDGDYWIEDRSASGLSRRMYGPKAGGTWPGSPFTIQVARYQDVPGLTAALAEATSKVASSQEAKAGVDSTKMMTPARVADAIGRGGIPVALFEGARPDDLPALIRRYGLTPFDGSAAAGQGYSGDDAPAFNTALERLRTGGGGSLIIPPTVSAGGRWRLGSPIQLHSDSTATPFTNVYGLGNKVPIERLGTTGDTFVAGTKARPAYYVQVKNVYLINQPGKSSGHDFKFVNASLCEIGGIVTDGTYSGFYGEDLNSFYGTGLVHFNMPNQTTGNAVTLFSDPAGSGRTDIVKFDELTVQARNAGSGGMVISGRVFGVHGDGIYMLGVSRALQMISSGTGLADIPSFCTFLKFEVDRAAGIAVVIEKAYRTEFQRCEISNTSGAMDVPYPQGSADNQAVLILQGAIDTKFIGGRIGNCREQAVYDDGKGTTLVGTSLTDMSKAPGFSAMHTGSNADGFAYSDLLVDGYGRATYAHQIEPTAKNGRIRGTRYQRVVNGYSVGTGTNTTNTEQVQTSYSYP